MNWTELDANVVWHPFTQMKLSGPNIPIVRGEGALLYDDKGNTYIDAIASWWMNLHGHAHPKLAEALYRQAITLEHVIFANFTHEPAVTLADRLIKLLPDNQAKIFYSDNGSTSVEVAIKMALQYWHNIGKPRYKIIALENAYHGDTFGAMSVGARSTFSKPFDPLLFEVLFIPTPTGKPDCNSLSQLSSYLREYKDQIAAFIFEPLVQGSGGMLMYPAQSLEELLHACKSEDIICIADEVMTGFGRTGTFWATSQQPVPADIYCLSKGLTGGTMALGLTSCTEKIYQAFWSDDRYKALFHGHSCTANPLACSVALASLDLTEDEKTWHNIQRIMLSHTEFREKLARYQQVENIRQTGVILAFDIKTDGQTSYFNAIRDRIWNFFIKRKLILRPLGNTIYILAPYCITEDQMNKVYTGIIEFLDQTH